jgi:hypothetical protein
MYVTVDQIEVGSIVKVREGFGQSPAIIVVVEEINPDHKNGKPAIRYTDTQKRHVWQYVDHITEVLAKVGG